MTTKGTELKYFVAFFYGVSLPLKSVIILLLLRLLCKLFSSIFQNGNNYFI